MIVEGRVSGQKTFRSGDNIYTENLIEVHQVIKGKPKTETVSVVTLGGRVGDIIETWTHLPAFSQNEYGVFFLVPTKRPVGEGKDGMYDVFSGSQGYYRFVGQAGRLKAVSVLESFNDVESLYGSLGAVRDGGGVSPFQATEKTLNCLKVKVVPKFELPALSATFEADIFVRTTQAPVSIHSINVVIDYDTVTFGSNVVASGNLTSTDGELVTSYYDLDFTDYSANQVEVIYEADGTDAASLEKVGTVYRKLATISLEIEGWSQDDPISWDENSGVVENYYVDGEGYVTEFDCSEVFVGAACEIVVSGMTPTTAAAGVGLVSQNGVPGVITITGSGFGNGQNNQTKPPTGARVRFDNTRTDSILWTMPFEGDYLKWKDDSIEVKVPSHGYLDKNTAPIADFDVDIACSGEVQVCVIDTVSGDDCCESAGDLYIPFSARNKFRTRDDGCKESVQVLLRNHDDEGGYTFYYGEGFQSGDTDWQIRRDSFKSALKKWRCATFVNFGLDETSNYPGGVGACLVEFDTLFTPSGTIASTKASTFIDDQLCNNPNDPEYAHLLGAVITLNAPLSLWNGITIEATFLHELGHVHQLNHTCNNPINVMTVANMLSPIDLAAEDILGGIHETRLGALVAGGIGCPKKMDSLTVLNCIVTAINIEENNLEVTVYPNPTNGDIILEFN